LEDVDEGAEVDEFGSIGWWREGEEDYLLHTTPGARLGKRRLGVPEGEASYITFDQDVRSFLLQDVDQDGFVDLLGLGTGLLIRYSVLTDTPTDVVLVEPTEAHAVYDVAVLDLDSDGDKDLVLGTNSDPDAAGQTPLKEVQNLGDRTWSEPHDILPELTPATFDLAPIDQDGDGHLDIYVCNDHGARFGSNFLLRGDGAGGLTLAEDEGLGVTTDCMGVSHADVNRDGGMDTFLTALDRHWLLHGDGVSAYDATASTLPPLQDEQMGWGSSLVDADNDGRVDIVVGTSDFSNLGARMWPLQLLRSGDDDTFTDIGGSVGLPEEAHSRAVITRDINSDGIVDILAADFSRDPWLMLSDGCGAGNWLEIDGPAGALVRVQAGRQSWTHLLTHNPGWGASQSPRVHLGLGEVDRVDLITLTLPGTEGPREVHLVGPVEVNQLIGWVQTEDSP